MAACSRLKLVRMRVLDRFLVPIVIVPWNSHGWHGTGEGGMVI